MTNTSEVKIPIGVSGCLLGEKVRYDGGDKYNDVINSTLKDYFELISFCPETGAGLGVPRPPVHLVKNSEGIRAVGIKDSSRDITEVLKTYAQNQFEKIAGIYGFIFKKGSPSCGLKSVNLFNEAGVPAPIGQGIFAASIISQFPNLPVVEESCLGDPKLREGFIQQVSLFYCSEMARLND